MSEREWGLPREEGTNGREERREGREGREGREEENEPECEAEAADSST